MGIPQWSEPSSGEEEDIGMRKCRRKINVEITNEEVEGKSSEAEEIKILNCSRKSHVETVNKRIKGSISEEEDIVIRRCRIIIRFKIKNK